MFRGASTTFSDSYSCVHIWTRMPPSTRYRFLLQGCRHLSSLLHFWIFGFDITYYVFSTLSKVIYYLHFSNNRPPSTEYRYMLLKVLPCLTSFFKGFVVLHNILYLLDLNFTRYTFHNMGLRPPVDIMWRFHLQDLERDSRLPLYIFSYISCLMESIHIMDVP